jgi:hypothetical protein
VWNCRRYKWASCTMHCTPTHPTTPTYPGKIIQPSPWAHWTPPPAKLKAINSEPILEVQMECWIPLPRVPGEQERGKEQISHCWTVQEWQGTKLSKLNSQWHTIKQQILRAGAGDKPIT